MYKTDLNGPESKNNDTITPHKNDQCRLMLSTVLSAKPLHNKIENQCSMNKSQSIVSLEEQIKFKQKLTIRKNFNNASIFQNDAVVNLVDHKLNQNEIISILLSNKKNDQQHKKPIIDNIHNSRCDKSIDTYELNDSDTKLDNMKLKMHHSLSIQKDDTSLCYKNIPNTIMLNLSQFFDKHRIGVKFNEIMALYSSEYGQAYEPLKYGFSSEYHMFESLDKMVKIKKNVLYTIDPFAYTQSLKKIDPKDNYKKTPLVLPGSDFLLSYLNQDICNGRFKYSKVKIIYQRVTNVIVSEIYNPSSFYIQLVTHINYLNSFMDQLQEFYNKNEKKYRVLPKLIHPNLTCIACLKNSNLWHRAIVLKIVDEENVQLFYVDYGSMGIVQKINIRLLQSRFGAYPNQAVHTGLYECNKLNYSRVISETFADMVDSHVLEAQFHPPISEADSQKKTVTLHLNTQHGKININKNFLKNEKLLENIKVKKNQESTTE